MPLVARMRTPVGCSMVRGAGSWGRSQERGLRVRRRVVSVIMLQAMCAAHLNWALITLMARRLTRKKPVPGWTKKQTATG